MKFKIQLSFYYYANMVIVVDSHYVRVIAVESISMQLTNYVILMNSYVATTAFTLQQIKESTISAQSILAVI